MKTYNWGIVGTGFIARKMAEALKIVPQSRLKAVASRNIISARKFAANYQIDNAWGSYEEVFTDPEVDIIYVATPHHLHCGNTLSALSMGKHVLCEKPFAVNGDEVRLMVKSAEEKNLFLMEALWSRFLPNIIKAKEIIDSGRLGKIRMIRADFGLNVPFDPMHRLYNRDLVGGSLLDLGIYPLFLTLLLMGKPESIFAGATIGATSVDYTCSFTLRYKDNVMAMMYSSILAETDITATIYCDIGKIVFDKWWYMPVPIKVVMLDGMEETFSFDFRGNGYQYEAMEVIKCLELGKVQSDLISWKDSLLLIDTLDVIRKMTGIHYPAHDH